MKKKNLDDRRLHQRERVLGTAMVFHGERWYGPFTVDDLSLGGVRVTGEIELPTETWVRVLLRLNNREPLAVAGKIVWREAPAATSFAVSFLDLAPEEEDLIHHVLDGVRPIAASL